MNRSNRPALTAGWLALLARANVPTTPKRMDMNTPYSIRASFDVYLDDVRQDGCCIEADAEKGFVRRWPKGEDGKYDKTQLETVSGKVVFKLRSPSA